MKRRSFIKALFAFAGVAAVPSALLHEPPPVPATVEKPKYAWGGVPIVEDPTVANVLNAGFTSLPPEEYLRNCNEALRWAWEPWPWDRQNGLVLPEGLPQA